MRSRPVDVAEVKGQIPPLDFYRAELAGMPAPRRDRGWVDGGLCPFHDDHRAGSFMVNWDPGAFICFSCGARGVDVVALVQMRDGMDFQTALQVLANAWGIRT